MASSSSSSVRSTLGTRTEALRCTMQVRGRTGAPELGSLLNAKDYVDVVESTATIEVPAYK